MIRISKHKLLLRFCLWRQLSIFTNTGEGLEREGMLLKRGPRRRGAGRCVPTCAGGTGPSPGAHLPPLRWVRGCVAPGTQRRLGKPFPAPVGNARSGLCSARPSPLFPGDCPACLVWVPWGGRAALRPRGPEATPRPRRQTHGSRAC